MSENNVVLPNPLSVLENNLIISQENNSNLTKMCDMFLKNKLYLVLGILVFGVLLYYLYTTYFKNKNYFKNLYSKSNEDNTNVKQTNTKKKVVFNDNKMKKVNKKVEVSSCSSSEDDNVVVSKKHNKAKHLNEPPHINNLDLTSDEIEMINNNLLEN
jgi:hypothetical protein